MMKRILVEKTSGSGDVERKLITILATGENVGDGMEMLTKNLAYIYTVSRTANGTDTAGFIYEVINYFSNEPTQEQKNAKPSCTAGHSQGVIDKWLKNFYLERYYSYDFWGCMSLMNQWPATTQCNLTERLWKIFRDAFPLAEDKDEEEYRIFFEAHPPAIDREIPTFKLLQDEIWIFQKNMRANQNLYNATGGGSRTGGVRAFNDVRAAGLMTGGNGSIGSGSPGGLSETQLRENGVMNTWKVMSPGANRKTVVPAEEMMKTVSTHIGGVPLYRRYTATKVRCQKCKHQPKCNGCWCEKCGLCGHRPSACGQASKST
jgi:hypothetical protein